MIYSEGGSQMITTEYQNIEPVEMTIERLQNDLKKVITKLSGIEEQMVIFIKLNGKISDRLVLERQQLQTKRGDLERRLGKLQPNINPKSEDKDQLDFFK